MSKTTTQRNTGADWTRLLSDPDLVQHIGRLLQAYRDAPPEKRDETLVGVMREIKAEAQAAQQELGVAAKREAAPVTAPSQVSPAPPFEPNLFGPSAGDDRRRHPRIKCFVAVEMHVDDNVTPVWGNLCNTSAGGCLVETATPVKTGSKVEIGLWVSGGKVWVKGFALNGIVTRSARSSGVRVKFETMETEERESLRQFLKYVQETNRATRNEKSYIGMLK